MHHLFELFVAYVTVAVNVDFVHELGEGLVILWGISIPKHLSYLCQINLPIAILIKERVSSLQTLRTQDLSLVHGGTAPFIEADGSILIKVYSFEYAICLLSCLFLGFTYALEAHLYLFIAKFTIRVPIDCLKNFLNLLFFPFVEHFLRDKGDGSLL